MPMYTLPRTTLIIVWHHFSLYRQDCHAAGRVQNVSEEKWSFVNYQKQDVDRKLAQCERSNRCYYRRHAPTAATRQLYFISTSSHTASPSQPLTFTLFKRHVSHLMWSVTNQSSDHTSTFCNSFTRRFIPLWLYYLCSILIIVVNAQTLNFVEWL